MIPLKPFSVKLPPEVKSRIKDAAANLGYSENKIIVEAVLSMFDMVEQPGQEIIPRIVVLIRAAEDYRQSPPQLGKRPEDGKGTKGGGKKKGLKKPKAGE